MALPLAARLRAGTQALHAKAEGTVFMTALLGGRLALEPYCLLLRQLHPIYRTLETRLLQHAADPVIAPVLQVPLFRTQSLAEDLDALHGHAWPDRLTLLPAAHAYVQRLEAAAPAQLVAHAYVRYLGDLSGGQMLRVIVERNLTDAGRSARPATGTRFYDFGTAPEVARLSQDFRAGLDAVTGDESCAQAIVAEAIQAFEMHVVLFEQLARACDLARAEPAAPQPMKLRMRA